MSLKHAILGFLSYAPAPMSGYDLKKAFDNSVRHFWPANQSQIYRTLAALTKNGLVELEEIERQERLNMKLYQITTTGRSELHRWLSTPLPAQDFREPLLIQVFFGGNVTDDELLIILRQVQQDIETRMALYTEGYARSLEKFREAADQRAFFLSLLTLEYGIKSERMALEWLHSARERLVAGDYALASLATIAAGNGESNV